MSRSAAKDSFATTWLIRTAPSETTAFSRGYTLSPLRGCDLPRLRDHIQQRWVAGFHSRDGAADRRSQILRVRNGTFGVQAVALRNRRIINVRADQCCTDIAVFDSAVEFRAPHLNVHALFVVRPIVMHDVQQ